MRRFTGICIFAAATAFISATAADVQDIVETRQDTAQIRQDMSKVWQYDSLSNLFPVSKAVKMGVLLPFSNDNTLTLKGNMDFYFGVLMAARQLEKEGYAVEIDTRDYTLGAFHYMSMGGDDDIVIGPFKYNHLCLAKSILCPSTTLISPLDPKAVALADSCFIQGPSVNEAQWAGMLEWEFEEGDKYGTNYIVVRSQTDTSSFREVSNCLKKNGLVFRTCSCDASHDISGWRNAYVEGMSTCVILALSNEATLNNAIRNMGILSRDKEDIRIYACSKAMSYRTISVEDVHKINLRVVCQYFVDYKDPATLDFIHTYRALFNSEPSQFSFQGYDIAYFMGRTKNEYGRDWRNAVLTLPPMKLLQSNVMIRERENGGLANFGVRRVRYAPDFNVIPNN